MIRFQDITIDRSKRTIARNGVALQFDQRRGFQLRFHLACHLILGGPMTRTALFDLLYDDREDGGPDSGAEVIDVMLHTLKPQFAEIGLELYSDRPYGEYRRLGVAFGSNLPKALEAAE